MTKIGLISDTHGWLDPQVLTYFKDRDEVWHAGDFGDRSILDEFRAQRYRFRGVYGNIDDTSTRLEVPEQLVFEVEGVKVIMRHIGGSPPKYNPATREELLIHQPRLFVCGHSHILKIRYDEKLQCLYMNPGAAGRQGWHTMRTILRFCIDGKEIKDCEVIELGRRG